MLSHHLQRFLAVPYRCNAAVLSRQSSDITAPYDFFVVYDQDCGFLDHFGCLFFLVLSLVLAIVMPVSGSRNIYIKYQYGMCRFERHNLVSQASREPVQVHLFHSSATGAS
jgi:hypothetical protein